MTPSPKSKLQASSLSPSKPLRLAVLGDVHYSTAGPMDCGTVLEHSATILQAALDQIVRLPQPSDVLIQLGDLVDGSNQSLEQARADFDDAVALLNRSGLRWAWIPGNHDVTACGGKRWLCKRLNRPRTYDELVIGDNVLLLLDSACDKMFGRVDAAQQAWLEQALELHRRRHIFVFVHHVFDWAYDYGMYIEEGDSIRALLLDCPAVKAIFVAHAHTPRISAFDGIYEIASGALSAWPLMFRTVEIAGECLRIASHKIAVPPAIEAAALVAHQSHPKPWDEGFGPGDLNADLKMRLNG